MKTSIALFPLCALTLIAACVGLRTAPTDATMLHTQAHRAALVEAPAPAANASPRTAPMRVLPTITVIANRSDFDAIDDGDADDRSVMVDTAVDSAGNAIVQPLRASLPRARLGNPFYDFGRSNSVPPVAE